MITQFKDEAMISYSVKYSFIDETGEDVDGVSRDVLYMLPSGQNF